MKNVTITLDEAVISKARVAREGKSLSRFVSELVQQRVGRSVTPSETMERFLAGPLMTSRTKREGSEPRPAI